MVSSSFSSTTPTPTLIHRDSNSSSIIITDESSSPLSLEISSTKGDLIDLGLTRVKSLNRDHNRDQEKGDLEKREQLQSEGGSFNFIEEDLNLKLELDEYTYPEGGLKAWLAVLSCFIFGCSQLGYGLAWGVLVSNLHETVYSHVPLSQLNLIVGLSNFLMASVSFIGGRLGDRYGYKNVLALGGLISFLSLIITAFTYQHLALIYLFQGVGLGIAQGISLPIILSIPSQYFLKKRGLVTGIANAGTGVGGAISSLLVRAMMPSLGYKNTILVYAGINAIAWSGAWYILEVRVPPTRPDEKRKWLPNGVGKSIPFYSLTASVGVGIFGYLNPFYFITAYTVSKVPSLDPSSLATALPLILANLASAAGRISFGLIADRVGPNNAMFTTVFLGGCAQMFMWPYCNTYGSIIAFGILYAFLGTSFMSLIAVCAAQSFGLKGLATLTGLVVLCNSPGQLAGATFAAMVLSETGSYASLARYSGGLMILGALLILPGRFKGESRVFARF